MTRNTLKDKKILLTIDIIKSQPFKHNILNCNR